MCPDVAGRGQSAWLPGALAYHFPQFLSDLRGLIAELRVEGVEWVGTSMGGLLGMMLAAQPRSPISRLVLNDIGAFVPAKALASIARNLRAPPRFDSLSALEEHVRHAHRDWGAMSEAHWRHLLRHRSRRAAAGEGYVQHFDPKIAQPFPAAAFSPGLSLWSAWHRLECPVLVIRGERSEILPRDVVAAMLAAKPSARAIEIRDAGHAPSLMTPEQIGLVADFLAPEVGQLQRAA